MILILGPSDVHTQRVAERIRARGEDVIIVASDTYPMQLTLSGRLDEESHLLLPDRIAPVIASEIQAVYWYAYSGVDPMFGDEESELSSAFGSFLRNLDCRWVNPPHAIEEHRYKAHQLKRLHRAGIRVPDTLITNEAAALVEFYEKHRGQVICKAFYQTPLFHKVTPEDLMPEQLARLEQSPTLFQEYIEGTDVRVHVMGETLFPSEISSKNFNYKTDFTASKIQLPSGIETDCRTIAKELGLVFTGIDFRRTPEGEYVAFEANPSPQYLIFEEFWDEPGYPLTEALVDTLLGI